MVISSMRIKLFSLTTRQTDAGAPSQLIERYRSQLSLYAEASSRSYQIDIKVEKYLILLGKDMV